MRFTIPLLTAVLVLPGCTAVRTTSPVRSAEQQIVIATAADRAAAALAAQVPAGISAWIDRDGMPNADIASLDQAYGLAAIEDALLRHGIKLKARRNEADAVILPRVGMLSTDERNTLFGIPSLPVPLQPNMVIPALSFYSQNTANGSAKFAASVYDAKSGQLIVSTDPAYGFSHAESGTALFLFTWRKNDTGVNFSSTPPRVGEVPPAAPRSRAGPANVAPAGR
ncbi:MAG TPA: DUF6655 family protein [Rhizomicrobium sp.]|nr:DUF6655 family protein [Rhizomicrobium sp.]